MKTINYHCDIWKAGKIMNQGMIADTPRYRGEEVDVRVVHDVLNQKVMLVPENTSKWHRFLLSMGILSESAKVIKFNTLDCMYYDDDEVRFLTGGDVKQALRLQDDTVSELLDIILDRKLPLITRDKATRTFIRYRDTVREYDDMRLEAVSAKQNVKDVEKFIEEADQKITEIHRAYSEQRKELEGISII